MIFDAFKHLLPQSKAWCLTANKQLREFFLGLSDGLDDPQIFIDDIWLDIFPETTRQLDQWEGQFALSSNALLTDQERRDRLTASWQALGGQSPRYIQDTLQSNGFDVYIHEWWDPFVDSSVGSYCGNDGDLCGVDDVLCANVTNALNPSLTVKNPFQVLQNAATIPSVDCGEAFAECGEPVAECGNSFPKDGFLLVNKIEGVNYFIPSDVNSWSYILYIGDQIYGDIAQIPVSRKQEFEALCLKICPAHLWLGMLIEYG